MEYTWEKTNSSSKLESRIVSGTSWTWLVIDVTSERERKTAKGTIRSTALEKYQASCNREKWIFELWYCCGTWGGEKMDCGETQAYYVCKWGSSMSSFAALTGLRLSIAHLFTSQIRPIVRRTLWAVPLACGVQLAIILNVSAYADYSVAWGE